MELYSVSGDFSNIYFIISKARVTEPSSLGNTVFDVSSYNFPDAASPTYKMYSVVKTQLSSAQVRPVVAGWMQVNDNGIPTHGKKLYIVIEADE